MQEALRPKWLARGNLPGLVEGLAVRMRSRRLPIRVLQLVDNRPSPMQGHRRLLKRHTVAPRIAEKYVTVDEWWNV